MDKSKVVIIKSFPTAGEALIYKSLLESGGVECELINVKLAVAEKDAEKAREILSAKFDQQEFDTESMKRRKKP